jgi:hypothetical protein
VSHGWRAGAALGMGFYGFLFIILLLRGPHCKRYTWIGYEGGLEAQKSVVEARLKAEADTALHAEAKGVRDLESAVVCESGHTKEKTVVKNDHPSLFAPDPPANGQGRDPKSTVAD